MPEDHSRFTIQDSTFIQLFTILLLAMTCYAYRGLMPRPFAADDFEWLLNVRGLDLGGVLRRAFDPATQHHFYRPLVWLLIWAEYHLFQQNPMPYHMVSLGLHLTNIVLLTRLVTHLLSVHTEEHSTFLFIRASQSLLPILAVALFALHPAPFEAVVWISAQSELLGACMLLLTLNLWLTKRPWATLLSLMLALLTKESAIIALLLMLLLRAAWRQMLPYFFLGIGYLILQAFVGQRNSVLQAGEYGFGVHMLSNPLRSLALLFAPLPNSEHADGSWLIPVGAMLALILAALAIYSVFHGGVAWRWVLGLALSLIPTAPFLSPPDSRYLYVPVALFALGLGYRVREKIFFEVPPHKLPFEDTRQKEEKEKSLLKSRPASFFMLLGAILMLLYFSSELGAREARFAAASGPGGSLWQLAGKICADVQPEHMLLIDAPIAPPHAIAIVQLTCAKTQPMLISRDQLSAVLRPASVVIAFPGGSAQVESWH